MALHTYLSIITLNINGLNAPTKKQRVAEWVSALLDPYICCLQETHLRLRDTHRLKVKGWKNISHKWKREKPGVAVLISDKIDFKTKAIVRDKGGHYIMVMGTIQEEDLVHIYASNIGAPKHGKQILMDIKGDIGSNIVIFGDFNTPLTSMDRSSRQVNQQGDTGLK